MSTENLFRKISLLLFSILVLPFVFARGASADVTVVTLARLSPSHGQSGITSIVIHGTGFPSGLIPPGNMTVQLTPVDGGASVATTAFIVGSSTGYGRDVSFIVPDSISVSAPTDYSVSLCGSTTDEIRFISSNPRTLTINPLPGMALDTASGKAGQTLRVEVTGSYTNFAGRVTVANFGPGISVGMGEAGEWGFLMVNSPTSATAIIRIDPTATAGPRAITVRTGSQDVTTMFSVDAAAVSEEHAPLLDTGLVNDLDSPDSGGATTYSVTDLGTLGGSSSTGYAINDNGQVTGDSTLADGTTTHAFLYSNGKMTDLHTLGGTSSSGRSINNSGQITGYSLNSNGKSRAFLYSGGAMSALITLGGDSAWGYGINNSGQVTGESFATGSLAAQPFLYSSGTITNLGNIGGDGGSGKGINSTGQVTGLANVDGGNNAFFFNKGKMYDLNTLSGYDTSYYSCGFSINDSGQITGTFETDNTGLFRDTFLFSNGNMNDLFTLGGNTSEGHGINNSGQVVGWSETSDGSMHAFIAFKNQMTDLNTLLAPGAKWTLQEAYAINTSGQITGQGISPSGKSHAFILTAIAPDLTITSTHKNSFKQGQNGAVYSIQVTNIGKSSTSGTVSVTDTLPTGLKLVSMNGSGWSCNPNTISCTNSTIVKTGKSLSPITLKVNVAADAPASVTNTATVSGGGDANAANNTATDDTTITPVTPDLTITKKHSGAFKKGKNGTYTIKVTNIGSAPTSGEVRVVDALPSGLTVANITGSGWNCVPATLTCTRSSVLKPKASYPPITLKVNIATNAGAGVTNTATVSGGGEKNTANDTVSDPTTIH